MRVGNAIKIPVFLALCAGTVFTLVMVLKVPSHDRDWQTAHAVLPTVTFDGDVVSLHNIRNFSYRPDGAVEQAGYYDADYDLAALSSVWYGISHFGGFGLAHTFLSFGFDDGRFLALSVEARLEDDETYGALAGVLRRYELIYVIADERDVVGLRTHVRAERVYLYPLILTVEARRGLLVAMLRSAEEIARRPTFYNTLTDNCTTNIVKYAQEVSFLRRVFDYRILLPGYSDGLAYDLGLIANDSPLEDSRQAARLDPARVALDDPDFSFKLRGLARP